MVPSKNCDESAAHSINFPHARSGSFDRGLTPSHCMFASISTSTSVTTPATGGIASSEAESDPLSVYKVRKPTFVDFLRHPAAVLAYVPKGSAMFIAGAMSGALAKTSTAPLDRLKLQLQVQGVQAPTPGKKAIGLIEAGLRIGREEGIGGYWKGNLPQVLRVIPYSAVQLFAYDQYKKIFQGNRKELSVPARLAAGACSGMTSTLVTYPLDVLRLRLAVDPASKSMSQVALTMLREEGLVSFYRGLVPSLVGIAPYLALNLCIFDLIKKSLPQSERRKSYASFIPALLSSGIATFSCYPLDTIRRQLQMKGTPYSGVFDAMGGILAKDGPGGFYRGFFANALKNLPNSSIRLGTYDAAKNLLEFSKAEYEAMVAEIEEEEKKKRK